MVKFCEMEQSVRVFLVLFQSSAYLYGHSCVVESGGRKRRDEVAALLHF
jgi:hypothetical protein